MEIKISIENLFKALSMGGDKSKLNKTMLKKYNENLDRLEDDIADHFKNDSWDLDLSIYKDILVTGLLGFDPIVDIAIMAQSYADIEFKKNKNDELVLMAVKKSKKVSKKKTNSKAKKVSKKSTKKR